jgi:hypothetical protein
MNKTCLEKNYTKQKEFLSNNKAISKPKIIELKFNSAVNVEKFVQKLFDQNTELMLLSFTYGCENIKYKLKTNNLDSSIKRIRVLYDYINKFGKFSSHKINSDFLDLKIEELILTHQYKFKSLDDNLEQPDVLNKIPNDIKTFLISLGYSQNEINQALQQLKFDENISKDKLLRNIIKFLS